MEGYVRMEFIIGSMNQAKVAATKQVIQEYYPNAKVQQITSDSGVPAQPIGDEETIKGAINRAKDVRKNNPSAFGIGLEGGVRKLGDTLYICNWGALSTPEGHMITAGGAQIPLPAEIAIEIAEGKELGPVIELYFNDNNLRQKEGAMGMFTAGAMTRVELFSHIVHLLIGQLIYYDKQIVHERSKR